MKYITVDGMLSGTGLRDSVNGGYIEPSSLDLQHETISRIKKWLKGYEDAHYNGFSNQCIINDLDKEGIKICRLLKSEIIDSKIEYYSTGMCRKMPTSQDIA